MELSESAQIPREAGTPVDLASIGSVVHVRVAHPPFPIFSEFLRMAVPHIAVESDLKQRHGEDFRGFGIGAIEFAAEPHGHAVDEEGVEENIAYADEQNGVESAPGEDSREGR